MIPWPGGAAWIDGRYCPIEEAKISVLDLGVTRSDCTYDVVHVWRGRFYRLDSHLDRFAASMARLRLDPGCSRAEQLERRLEVDKHGEEVRDRRQEDREQDREDERHRHRH